jgi:RluA family pseudouridine synthase
MKLRKIYEDEHLIAFNKPRGLLTVAAQGKQPNLYDMVKAKYSDGKNKIMALHRLDRDTSGVVLFSKTQKCYEEAVKNKKFTDVKKTYVAIVVGKMERPSAIIENPLPSRRDKKILIPAFTSFKVIKVYQLPMRESASLVQIEILHGRKHQIRIHFTSVRHPLLMDREYMERKRYKYFQKLIKLRHYFLHAKKMNFKHFITGLPMEILADPVFELKEAEQKL